MLRKFTNTVFESEMEIHFLRNGFGKSDSKDLGRERVWLAGLIDKAAKSIELLREYRTALISAAVTGKIDVRSN